MVRALFFTLFALVLSDSLDDMRYLKEKLELLQAIENLKHVSDSSPKASSIIENKVPKRAELVQAKCGECACNCEGNGVFFIEVTFF